MRTKSAWTILALVAVGGVWMAFSTSVQSQNAVQVNQRGDDRLTSSLELASPYSNSAQNDFEQQLTFDERASLIRLNSRSAIADSDCPLPTNERQPFYVKLHEPMTRAFALRLEDAGASFLGYAYSHSHFMRARDADSLKAIGQILRQSNNVAGTLLRKPVDACSEDAWVLLNDGVFQRGNFRVLFWGDVSLDRMTDVLVENNVPVIQATRDTSGNFNGHVRFIDVILDQATLRAFSRHDDIEWVQPRHELVTHNVDSRALANAREIDIGPGTSYDLTGDGLVVCVFDGGVARDTHADFQNGATGNPFAQYFPGIGDQRVLEASDIASGQPGWGITDTSPLDAHPTHVTGTVVADGASEPLARGFAPEAYAISMGWGSMENERQILRHYFRHVADNHSYGSAGGLTGGYDASTQTQDIDIRDIWLNMTKSAGNDGSGDDTCTDDTCIKNVYCIAATEDNGDIASFSSRGPTDDGRMIPHFAANGVALTSTGPNSDTHHMGGGTWSGTSMSAPSVCGSLVLLSELWQREMNDRELAPDVGRALLAATADDRYNQGPDYRYGFGVIDVQRAADLILANSSSGGDHIVRGTIRQFNAPADAMEYDLQVTNSAQPLKVVCSWLDVYASTGAGTKLVNNIDVELIEPNGTTVYYPWRGLTTNGAQTHQWTRNNPNERDNIELVEVDNPVVGTWTIRVTGTSIPSTPQPTVLNDSTGFVLVSETPITTMRETFEDPLNTSVPIGIPDGNPTGASRTFNVNNNSAVRNVRVYVDIRHEARGDLEIVLEHPDTTTAMLEGSDASTRRDIIGVYPDTRQYDDDTIVFVGKPANGTWTVHVRDLTAGNTGTIEYLAIEIDYDPNMNQPPIADAGVGQTVFEGAAVNLNGSGTDPDNDPLTYSWSQLSGPGVSLTSNTSATPSFIAPAVSAAAIATFELTVDDSNGGSDVDTVDITILDAVVNNPPAADAGVDFQTTHGANTQLDGSQSSDPDSDPLTYAWTQISGTSVTLTGADTATPSFTAPGANATLLFELIVNDGNGGMSNDFVTVNVADSGGGGGGGFSGGGGGSGGGGCSTGAQNFWLLLLMISVIAGLLALPKRNLYS